MMMNVLAFAVNVQLFLETLPIMAKGLIGIFAVTGVIILSIFLLNKLTAPRKKKDEADDTASNQQS